jgi:S1-C subfamily serine protease
MRSEAKEARQLVPGEVGDLRALEKRVQETAAAVTPAVVAVAIPGRPHKDTDLYQNSYASGVIVTAEGTVLSQWHVSHRKPTNDVNGLPSSYHAGQRTRVILHDGRVCPAELLGADLTRDLSLLRLLPPGPYPHAPIHTTTVASKGDWVVMMGHPLGYRQDRGAVLRLGRILLTTDDAFIADCTFCGGDSGAPFFDLNGRLIGVYGPGYGDLALVPKDPMLARRCDQSFLFSVTRSYYIHKVLKAMQHAECLGRNSDEGRRVNHELNVTARLRSADYTQGRTTVARFRSVVAATRTSVVQVLNGGVPVALGTVVGEDGLIVTKGSELPPTPRCRLHDGRIVLARFIRVAHAFDLALLRVHCTDLTPVRWAKGDPRVGSLLAAASNQELPLAVGVVSVARRDMISAAPPDASLPLRVTANRPGVFGTVQPAERGLLALWARSEGYLVTDVFDRAWEAGIRPGDLLLKLGAQPIHADRDTLKAVEGRLSGDVISAVLQRKGKVLTLPLPLGPEPEDPPGTDHSYRRDNFPAVFECAVPFFTTECGGPLVDLNGHAVGITVCRVAPHGGMAIPGDCIQRLMSDMAEEELMA